MINIQYNTIVARVTVVALEGYLGLDGKVSWHSETAKVPQPMRSCTSLPSVFNASCEAGVLNLEQKGLEEGKTMEIP